MNIPLPATLVQAVVNYLISRPWAEVNELMIGIQQAAQIVANPQVAPVPVQEPALQDHTKTEQASS